MPVGAPATGGGGTAGVEDKDLLGLGGAALLGALGLTWFFAATGRLPDRWRMTPGTGPRGFARPSVRGRHVSSDVFPALATQVMVSTQPSGRSTLMLRRLLRVAPHPECADGWAHGF